MKFFLFLVVALIGAWFWRQRSLKRDRQKAQKPTHADQRIMLSCRVCGVHVPDNEAVAGQHGAYCSAEHRRQAEPPV